MSASCHDGPALSARFAAAHPGTSLRLALAEEPPSLSVIVKGDLDSDNAADFLALCRSLLPEAALEGGLSVDLEGLGYISSTGVGALATLMTESMRCELLFWLCRVPERTRAIIDALGLWTFFDVVDRFRERP